MVGGAGVDFRRFDFQGFQIVEKGLYVFLSVFLKGNALRSAVADGFIIYIGDVLRLGDFEAFELEIAAQNIFEDISPEIADVRIVINRGPAGVDLHFAGDKGDEFLFAAGEGVVEVEGHILRMINHQIKRIVNQLSQ